VDGILAAVDGFATSGGTLHLDGNPAPSGTGAAHVTALQGRGWTVTTGPGPLSVVQTATSYTFGSNVTAGNTIIVVSAAYSNSSGAMTSSSPTFGGSAVTGSFAAFAGTGNGVNSGLSGGNAVYVCCWVLPNVAAGHNNVALTLGGGANQSGVVMWEVHGLGASPVLGSHSTGSGLTGAAVDAGFMPIDSTANAICVGMAQIYGGGSAAPASPWVNSNPTSATFAGYRFFVSPNFNENGAWLMTNSNTVQPWAAGIAMVHA
jgi:hypothetical protein